MVARSPYPPGVTTLEQASAPPAFAAALGSLHRVVAHPARSGLALRQVPAPRRLAPWSVAVVAELAVAGEQVAGGRFVVLHDPVGQQGWHGDTRVVAYVQAQVETEMAADPSLADVGWSWLVEALEVRAATCAAAGGTVTRTLSSRYGELEDAEDTGEASSVEVRASWTALAGPGGLQLGDHLLAWCDLICLAAGVPPPAAALRPA